MEKQSKKNKKVAMKKTPGPATPVIVKDKVVVLNEFVTE